MFQIAIENAVLVALVAPLIWAVSRLVRRPALVHALWLILLIKLVMPPLYRPALHVPHSDAVPSAMVRELDQEPIVRWRANINVSTTSRQTDATAFPLVPELTIDVPRTPLPPSHTVRSIETFIPTFEIVWLAGSLVCLLISLARIVRFSRGLRHAYPAPPELQERVAKLSRQLGLHSTPWIYFIPAPLCPMLWAVGRSPRLLIPVALWARLDVAERDSILLHELAHWRRRDHWVRWIELAATTIYWWNPICWWARRELREAEEQCCDAWVLHATGDFKPYANALLRAVEFISAPISTSPKHNPLPALASGMGQFNHLKRRIVMLKTASVARALSPRTLVAALGFSAMLLPLSPSLKGAPETPPTTPAAISVGRVERAPDVADTPATTAGERRFTPVTIEIGSDDLSSPEDQLKAARKEIQDLRQKLAQAEAELARYRIRDRGRGVQNGAADAPLPPANQNQNSNGKPGNSEMHISGDTVRLERIDGDVPGVHDRKYRTAITDDLTGRIKEIREVPLTANPTHQADRLDKLEAQLRDLLREVRSLRQQSTPPETPDVAVKK